MKNTERSTRRTSLGGGLVVGAGTALVYLVAALATAALDLPGAVAAVIAIVAAALLAWRVSRQEDSSL